MSDRDWQSSEYQDRDRLAGVKAMLARVFGDGENPIAWGFRVAVFRGIPIKLHLLFVVYLIAELIFTLPGNRLGFVYVLPRLIAMVMLVLSREVVHSLAAKRAGGETVEIMLWPMGGLVAPELPDDSNAELKVALSPILFHLMLFPILAIPLYILTQDWQALLFNPLSLRGPEAAITFPDGTETWWLVSLGAIHGVNLVLLIFNLLLPMYPLDLARVLEAVMKRTNSVYRAQWITVHTGLIVATAVGILAIVMQNATPLFALCVVCGLICSMHRRRLQFLATADMIPGYSPGFSSTSENKSEVNKVPAGVDQVELDRILSKISSHGIQSLSRKEQRTLKRATETSRESK